MLVIQVSSNLCDAIAGVAQRICTGRVSPSAISALLAFHPVPLNKNPGVHRIGVGEVVRRMIGKAIMKVVKKDVMFSAGPLQVCSDIPSGGEAAVHAVRESFESSEMKGVLLIDALNTFNSLNRKVALLNMRYVFPALETMLTNCYQSPIRLFVSSEGEVLSKEGTTQGAPLGINLADGKKQKLRFRFADDATGVGTLVNLKQWWSSISTIGPLFGHHPNAAKTCLVYIVCNEQEEVAKEIFGDIYRHPHHYRRQEALGGPLGSPSFVKDFISCKVKEWTEEVEKLAAVAGSQCQPAYVALSMTQKRNGTTSAEQPQIVATYFNH